MGKGENNKNRRNRLIKKGEISSLVMKKKKRI